MGVMYGFCCVWTSCLAVGRVGWVAADPLHTDRTIDPCTEVDHTNDPLVHPALLTHFTGELSGSACLTVMHKRVPTALLCCVVLCANQGE